MNRIFWERVVIFAAGLLIGSFSTYQFTKEKMEKQVQEELESIREVYARQAPDKVEPSEEREESTFISTDMDRIREQERIDYNKIATVYTVSDKSKDVFSGDPRPVVPTDRLPAPYVIDTQKYSEECQEFDKLTIYYYAGDDTLVDEGEEIIVDVRVTIGDEALDNFGVGSVNPDIVYVRNERISIDYEVVRLPSSYSQTVLGGSSE